MTNAETYTATIWIDTLEAGTHISRETIATRVHKQVVLKADDCCECRPDYGEYSPIPTYGKTIRTLKAMGQLPRLSRCDEEYRIGIVPRS